MVLTACAIPMLIAGNMWFPIAEGRDLTPFEVGGVSFFFCILPLAVFMAAMHYWRATAIAVGAWYAVVGSMAIAWLGVSVGIAWLSVALLLTVLSGVSTLARLRTPRGQAG